MGMVIFNMRIYPHPSAIKNYNLVNFTPNGMQPTRYFEYLRNTLTSSIDSENKGPFSGKIGMQSQTNTISAIVSITKVDGKQPTTDYHRIPLIIPLSKVLENQSVAQRISG